MKEVTIKATTATVECLCISLGASLGASLDSGAMVLEFESVAPLLTSCETLPSCIVSVSDGGLDISFSLVVVIVVR